MAESKGEDQQQSDEQDNADETQEDTSAGSKNTDTSSKADESVPRARLNEEINRRRAADKKLADLEKQNREREEATAAERGEFKNLAEQRQKRIDELEAEVARLKDRAERADTLEGQLRTSLKSRLDKLPEEVKALAPIDLDEADPVAIEKWLPGAERLATKLTGSTGQEDGKNGKSSARGAGPSPKAKGDDKAKGELLERARRSQQGFTIANF